MSSIRISIFVFVLLFGGALLGLYASSLLPAEQFKAETKSHMQTEVGLLTSMFALLLSLQLSSGKTAFDAQEQDIALLAAKTVMLDRILIHYGPEAQASRESLARAVLDLINRVWPSERKVQSTWVPTGAGDELYDTVQKLSPTNDIQSAQRSAALATLMEIGHLRWKSAERIKSSTEVPLRVVELVWATIIFVSYGLMATPGAMAIGSLALCAAAVAAGFFLIVEMNRPFIGVFRTSSAPLREALTYIAR